MDENLIQKYKDEMLKMYKSVNSSVRVPAIENTPTPKPTPQPAESTVSGNLIGIVTAIRSLYPVKNAKVTIFKGEYPDMEIIDSDTTDESGRTKTFRLPAPEKALSLEQENTVIPYSTYNMLVEADGYIKNIHLGIPIFSTVTSLQESNLILEETAGEDKSPQIFDESANYGL